MRAIFLLASMICLAVARRNQPAAVECSHYPPATCEDYDTDTCEAHKEKGLCESDTAESWRVCQLTCKMCGPDATCRDEETSCQEWADNKQCEENPSYMHVYCRKACECC